MGFKKYLKRKRNEREFKQKQEETLQRYKQLTQEEINSILDTRKKAYMEIALQHVELIGQKEATIDFPIPVDNVQELEEEDDE